MASIHIFQGRGFNVALINEGTSPIPNSVNVSTSDGDSITITIEQMKQLKGLLELAIFAEQSARKANPNAIS